MGFAQTLLQSGQKFSALAFGEDLTAIGTMKGLQSAGLCVPEDVAIVGFNNSMYARLCTPELTSVDNKFQLLGEYSATLLKGLLDGLGKKADIQIRPVLVERGSS